MLPLLQQFVTPMLQLRGDCLDAGGLFNCAHFDASGVVSTEWRFRELHHGMFGVRIETFAESVQHLDGGAQLGGGGCLHNQT